MITLQRFKRLAEQMLADRRTAVRKTAVRRTSAPAAIAALLLCLGAHLTVTTTTVAGAELVTATITLTNIPAGLTSNLTINASTRFWTNSPVSVLSTHIQTTNTVAMSATNLLNHLTAFPVDTGWQLSQTSPTNVIIRARVNQTLTITLAPSPGWAFVTYTTNTVSTPTWLVRVPITVENATNQTNIASLMTKAISDYSTNAIATNSTAGSNYLTKGASPQQYVASPVQYNGTLRAAKEVMLTNGFTASVTNINSVSSNHINFGSALRSEGPGGNSLQLGSNAMARAALTMAIGNDSVVSNANTVAMGIGAKGLAGDSVVIGANAAALTNANSGAGVMNVIGANSGATGEVNNLIAPNSWLRGVASSAMGWDLFLTDIAFSIVLSSDFAAGPFTNFVGVGHALGGGANNAAAFGALATATHINSAAIGPPDDAGTAVTTTATNQIRLGTSRHRISAPGLYESPAATNSQFAGTNIARGSWSHPAFVLSTLAAGNNISVPFATNAYIRCGAGPVSAATICGIIGAATSGGLDGQFIEVMNDTGFTLTFAVSTADPVPANRINTPLGTDVSIADQGWAYLRYDGADARWKVIGTFPVTVTLTNTPFSFITSNLLSGQVYTNLAQRGQVVANIALTNVLAGDVSAMSLIVDQNGDGTWDTTNGPARLNGVALLAGEQQLTGLLQPGARFAYTNQSAGASPSVSIRSGSCQWSIWW